MLCIVTSCEVLDRLLPGSYHEDVFIVVKDIPPPKIQKFGIRCRNHKISKLQASTSNIHYKLAMATLIARSRLGSPRNVAFVSRALFFSSVGAGLSRSGTAILFSSSSSVHRTVLTRKSLEKLPQKRWLNSSPHQKNALENSAAQSSESSFSGSKGCNSKMTFWERFLAPKPMPERNTVAWYRELALICTVFGITGSATMFVSRFVHDDNF